MFHTIFLWLIMALLPVVTFADDARAESPEQSLIVSADRLALSKDAFWLRLLHIPRDRADTPRSDIRSDEFFLAADGRTDPAAELRETLRAFFSGTPRQA